jgi:Secretion system C-terminal sorting domain
MKAILSKHLRISVLSLFAIIPIASFAQEKKDKIRIKIEQEIDGKIKIDEKVIDATGLSESQKEAEIQKFQDSVIAQNKGKAQGIKVEVESESGNNKNRNTNEQHFSHSDSDGSDQEIVIKQRPRVKVYRRNGNGKDEVEIFNGEEFSRELNGNMESLKDNLKEMGKELKFEYRTIPDGFFFNENGASSAKTVRGVEVFPNNPKTEILNVRFNAPQKGDVSIKVLDVKGNVVAKEEIKDFLGEYVGQINIGKQIKGTIFVMITQGEDGTVKRVVLPAN